jgi:hypothetical protein
MWNKDMADAALDRALFEKDSDAVGDVDHFSSCIGSDSKLFHGLTPSLSH